ncbi:MAG: hypothetical protein OEL87_02500 [Nanoarchaeota archaeon]|nr:hypothetical protein [Nanoarchaeota archaeon]
MNMKKILAEQLKIISPSKDEITYLSKTAKEFVASLKKAGVAAQIGGSLAKGTLIQKEGKQDVDIFAVFNYSEDTLKLEKILKKIKLPGKLKKVHGSRDYFQIDCDSVILEIIPVVKNKDPELAENVTDVSLSHVKYISGEIKKNPEIANEIRLAKSFCVANRCYGAEGYVQGFSGYSLEILVIHFGGFIKFLKGIQKKKTIDPLKYFKNEKEILREINTSKLNSPLILIDPTYKYRNVSAGLGSETFIKFIETANQFLKSPSLELFKKREIDTEKMKILATKNKAKFIEINLTTDRQEGDIAGTKMKKLLNFFERELIRKQQQVLAKEFDYPGKQTAKGYLVIKEKPEIELRGPPVGLENAIENFKKANKHNVSTKKGYYWHTEKTNINKIFNSIKKVEKEMGASGKLV